jgi:hypothetical protein
MADMKITGDELEAIADTLTQEIAGEHGRGHIRKDGQPGERRRTGRWNAPEELPSNLAALVEAARPGWWSSS